jgi:NADPH-dependent 2,4-dienoyl-CoA reductase/sulfur reductase-like enzyme
VAGDTIRCPWHHACFSLRTGTALGAPAFDPIPRWRVERKDDRVFVREKLPPPDRLSVTGRTVPSSICIVGGGAAGFAAAHEVRRQGYDGPLTMISADNDPPYDRPNLSKDFLGGDMPPDWLPLQTEEFYKSAGIELLLRTYVKAIDARARQLLFDQGPPRPFDRLLIATGADPVRLQVPGASEPHVHYLRSIRDSQAILEASKAARRVVVIGAGFIGLEVAAALRDRGIDVDVAAPEAVPLERVMGREIGSLVRRWHESHGVTFHLGQSLSRVDDGKVTLTDGTEIPADMVIVGVGVRPAVALAEGAGLAVDHGIVVNELLETSAAGIFAAGDVARWPDRRSGDRIRVEHWVVAERQGQTAGRNLLGFGERFEAVPFFWSKHYDTTIRYVGHAENWDDIRVDGSLDAADCSVTFSRGGRRLAVATIGRNQESLRAEREMETESAGVAGAAVGG